MNYVDSPFQSPATLSICTGIGGLERGVKRVIGPLRTIAYVEIEAFIIENLLAGMEAGILGPAPIWANLKTFPWRQLRGKVDILMGGYPCQPFSNAGIDLGTNDPRHLWPYIEGGIYSIRPVCCFFENVAAHLNKGYREVKWSLEKMGYIVKEGIYAAEEVGAPHLRERLFILAVLGNAGRPSWWPDDSSRHGHNSDDIHGDRQEGAGRPQCPGEELADSGGLRSRCGGETPGWQERKEFDSGMQELANPDGYGNRAIPRGPGQKSCDNEGASQGKDGQWLRGFVRDGSKTTGVGLADSCREGLEIGGGNFREQSPFSQPWMDCWPARPGQPQQTWESPRVISRAAESDMGLSIDGYSFREDLLRALGNSVVERQAEYAFRDLMRKHSF